MKVEYATRGQVAWIRLRRPQALNALNVDTLQALAAAMDRADADSTVRSVVLTGEGRAFCAGGDIKQLREEISHGAAPGRGYIDAVTKGFERVRSLKKPLIGCVNGVAVGGGLELLLCCDLVVASETARIGDGHANFGIFPGGGSSALLPRRIPLNQAKLLLFTGRLLTAQEWLRLGLVNQIAAPERLEAETQELAEELATKSPRLLARLKAVANSTADKSLSEALRDELAELRTHMQTADMWEGTSAFIEKRTPLYTGN